MGCRRRNSECRNYHICFPLRPHAYRIGFQRCICTSLQSCFHTARIGDAAARAHRCPFRRTPCIRDAAARAHRCHCRRTPYSRDAAVRAHRCSGRRTPYTLNAAARGRIWMRRHTFCILHAAARGRRCPCHHMICICNAAARAHIWCAFLRHRDGIWFHQLRKTAACSCQSLRSNRRGHHTSRCANRASQPSDLTSALDYRTGDGGWPAQYRIEILSLVRVSSGA